MDLQAAWRQQIEWCRLGGSPFTAGVLEAAWHDWTNGGALREVMPDWAGDPLRDAVALRVAAALHSLVLDDSDPTLTDIYPPRRIDFDPTLSAGVVQRSLRAHRDRIADYLSRPPQTNEIGRSAVLLGGFAVVAQRTSLPLSTLEIGASAGLNLLWHRFRYELGATSWGDPQSPVTVRSQWDGPASALPPVIDVVRYAGCDLTPIDVNSAGAAVRLLSYVWPDQKERIERLQSAIALAQRECVRVEPGDAHDF